MRTICLYGNLAEQFAPSFKLEVFSAAEAIRALEANFPGRFFKALAKGEYHLVKGKDITSGEDFSAPMMHLGLGANDLHIMPALAGSGDKAIFQVVLGVAIIGASIMTAGAAAGAAYGLAEGIAAGSMASTTFLGVSMASFATFGAAMAISGLSSMLTPTPTLPGTGTKEAVDPRKSFVFQGPENRSGQGGPVAVVYGKYLVGSTTISASISVEDIA